MARVLQHLGVSEQSFHRWRNQYGGMKSAEARRLKELDISILREANEYLGRSGARSGVPARCSASTGRRSGTATAWCAGACGSTAAA
jgi:hypothetical protein